MLHIIKVSRAADKKNLLSQFIPEKDTWVVSDLKTKIFLKSTLLDMKPLLYQEPIKRAAELWNAWLREYFIEYKSVGGVGQWALAKKYLSIVKKSIWHERPGAAQTLLHFSKQMASFVTHELAEEHLAELNREFPQAHHFFNELASLSMGFYQFCLKEKTLPHFFVPALLLRSVDTLPREKVFYFDLGEDLLLLEKDLIHELSKNNQVYVLIPETLAESATYKSFGLGVQNLKEEITQSEKNISPPHYELWHCTSMDSEARKAAEQISSWVRSGVKAADICVVSRDISFYENLLDHDLKWQGIVLNRDLSSPIAGMSFFRTLGARLRIVSGTWKNTDLSEAFPEVSVSESKMLAPAIQSSQIFIPDIMQKVLKLEMLHSQKFLNYKKFEALVLKVATEIENIPSDHVIKVFQKIQAEVHSQLELDLITWTELWQKTVAQQDFIYKKAKQDGVWAVNYSSIDEVPASYFIFLGMNTENQRRNYFSSLSVEMQRTITMLGFEFNSSDVSWDHSLEWFVEGRARQVILSHTNTDAQGKTLAPSEKWLRFAELKNKSMEKFDTAADLLWIHSQKNIYKKEVQSELEKIKGLPSYYFQKTHETVSGELSGTRAANLKIGSSQVMSASALEQMWSCPFKFLAAYGFGLRDDDGLEVEPTPQLRGQILHSAAEEILKQGLDNWNEQKVTELLDQLGEKQKDVSSDVWPSTRIRILRQLMRFMEFEKSWRLKFPLSRTVGFEVPLMGYIQYENEELQFYTEPREGALKFKGKIDRVDTDPLEQAVLIDYKDKLHQLTNISSWHHHGQFQLALYAQALKAGLSEIKVKNILGAFYYSLKNLKREQGFIRRDFDRNKILPEEFPRNSQVDEKEFTEFIKEINSDVGTCLQGIERGDFTPQPKKQDYCKTCSWNQLCRSHHLM